MKQGEVVARLLGSRHRYGFGAGAGGVIGARAHPDFQRPGCMRYVLDNPGAGAAPPYLGRAIPDREVVSRGATN